jgi:hypothetical protein
MQTKESLAENCCCSAGKHKKVIFGAVLIVGAAVLIIAIAMHNEIGKRNDHAAGVYGCTEGKCMTGPAPYDDFNQFAVPQDAAKTGSLEIAVDDMYSTRQAIARIAERNGGAVYSTDISYARKKNFPRSSIVIQIPLENFDATFTSLKTIGVGLLREATQNQTQNNIIYPMEIPVSESVAPDEAAPVTAGTESSTVKNDVSQGVASAEPVIGQNNDKKDNQVDIPSQSDISVMPPNYYPRPFFQNKGYIKITFVDYFENKPNFIGGGLTAGNYAGLNLRDNLYVVLALKSILLVILLGVLLLIMVRIFRFVHKKKIRHPHYHEPVHIGEDLSKKIPGTRPGQIRQISRNPSRVVRIKRK